MAASEFPQHERLTRVLNIYRRAMRRHIAEQWRGKHADEWFDRLYEQLPKRQQNEIQATRATLDLRRAEGELAISKADEDEFLIDIPMFLEAVKSRSDLFGPRLVDWEMTRKIANVYRLRNTWAHPPVRDLRASEVSGVADDCASILELFDPVAADAVRGVTTGDASLSSSDSLLERIEHLQGAIDARSLPTEHLREMLGQLLVNTSQAVEQDEGEQEWAKVAAELRALREERAVDDLTAEIRALRAEVAASQTWVGGWWARCEREISVWLDRLAGRR